MKKTATPAVALPELVEDYLTSCRAAGQSAKTVDDNKGYPLRRVLLPFCHGQGIETMAQLNQAALDRFSVQLQTVGGPKGPLAKATIHTYVRQVNTFRGWAAKRGQEVNGKGQAAKPGRRHIEILSRAEIDRLEDRAKSERSKLIVRTLADSGLRVGELVGLRVRDVTQLGDARYLRVTGKADRPRMVPITPELYRRLVKFAAGRPETERLFLTDIRRPGRDFEPVTTSGVQQFIRKLAKDAGITKRVHPHLFRHSYATWMINRHVSPHALADILGHSGLQMIQSVYAHLAPEDTYAAMMAAIGRD